MTPRARKTVRRPLPTKAVRKATAGADRASAVPPVFDRPAAEILWLLRKNAAPPSAKIAKRAKRARSAPQNFTPSTIYDLAAATLTAFWNEIAFDGKPNTNDTTKWRFGAFRSDQTGYIAAITADILEGGRRLEKIIIALKLESSPESRAAGLPSIPMVEVFCHKYGDSSTNDADMLRVVSLSAHEILCWVPLRLAAGGAQPPVTPPHPPLDPTVPPVVVPPPATNYVYSPTVKGVGYNFRMGHWEDIRAVFPFPVDEDVVGAYLAAPSESHWRVVVDRMFVRRDD